MVVMAQHLLKPHLPLSFLPSYILPITGLLNGLLTSSAETEQEMVACERVLQYLLLPAEGQPPAAAAAAVAGEQLEWSRHNPGANEAAAEAGKTGGLRAPLLGYSRYSEAASEVAAAGGGWLREGRVEFFDVWLLYRPSTLPALAGLSLTVLPGTSLGICGRTGAGKSSVLACMLRLVEPCGGRVALDGVDIRLLPLHALRSAMGVMPQQTFLFEGSVRENLDPEGRASDSDLEAALRAVQLWTSLAALAGRHCVDGGSGSNDSASNSSIASKAPATAPGTDTVLSLQLAEGLCGLSAGQAQLLAFARVLLRRPRLLLLDEATASVDSGTASLIRRLVRSEFEGATVLEVAHRLESIKDCNSGASGGSSVGL